MAQEQFYQNLNFKQKVITRGPIFYLFVDEIGEMMTALGKRLGISTATVSRYIRRGGQKKTRRN